jgi:hypothetical protein
MNADLMDANLMHAQGNTDHMLLRSGSPRSGPQHSSARRSGKAGGTETSPRASRPCWQEKDQSELFVDNLGPQEVLELNIRLRSMWADIQAKYVRIQGEDPGAATA